MDIFNRFKSAVKLRQIVVDNEVFQLHYRVTAILLLGCAGLVASKQHFGDPIDCITKDDVPNKIMDTYCWIHSTFTLPAACNKTVGIEVAHPCVDKFVNEQEERVYHKYYQWVYFVLFFQAAFFYAPHFFWKMYESRLMTNLTADLKSPMGDRRVHITLVAQYLSRNRLRHQAYFYYFTVFEVANFLNVLVQMYMVDAFLGGAFTNYGLDVWDYIQMEDDRRVDPMIKIFPRMTKCSFHRFGPSGDVQKYDSLCILPLNVINEKIYIVMWFWFLFLAIITGGWLVFRLLTLALPQMRYSLLRRRASLAGRRQLKDVLDRLDSGDWFLLSMMCKNMDSRWFRVLIKNLSANLRAIEKNRGNGRNFTDLAGSNTEKKGIIDDISDAEIDDNTLSITKIEMNKSVSGSDTQE